jgi:exonuclease III
VIRHVSKTAKAISSDKSFLFNPEYTNLNGGEIFCKSDNIQSVYNKLGFDSSRLKQDRIANIGSCEHSSLCNILSFMRSSSFMHEQIAHTIVDGFKTWKCPHFDTCNFQISQDLLFLPNEWDSYFDTKIKNLNDERLANNKNKLSKKELQEIQIERGLHGLKFYVIPLIYYEIFNHFRFHAFNDLFIKMLLKKPRLPLNETKILSFNVGGLQYHWENILLSILRSDFVYDFLLFQETKGYEGTIPGYENNSSKKCQSKYTTKVGTNVEKTIHGVTSFNCTLQTTDGQIMKATQLSLENFLNKQTVLKKWNVLQNMSVIISMFKKIQFDSDSNTCFRYNNSGLFNVIANVYAPNFNGPYSFHAEPLLNEILPNLMENENFKIRLFCGDSNAPIIWKNFRNPSTSIRNPLPNSKILIEQFTNNTNLRQHNMDIANTSGHGHGNLIDVVIDTFDPQKN